MTLSTIDEFIIVRAHSFCHALTSVHIVESEMMIWMRNSRHWLDLSLCIYSMHGCMHCTFTRPSDVLGKGNYVTGVLLLSFWRRNPILTLFVKATIRDTNCTNLFLKAILISLWFTITIYEYNSHKIMFSDNKNLHAWILLYRNPESRGSYFSLLFFGWHYLFHKQWVQISVLYHYQKEI